MRKFISISFVAFIFFACIIGCNNEKNASKNTVEVSTSDNADKSKNEILLVKYHADWCGSCKTLSPMLVELNSKLAGEKTKYIELNLTDEITTLKAKKVVAELGISALAEKQKTGFVAIIDANSKKLLGKLTKTQSVDEMYTQVLSHL